MITENQEKIIESLKDGFIKLNGSTVSPIDVLGIKDFVLRKNKFIMESRLSLEAFKSAKVDMMEKDVVLVRDTLSPLGFKVYIEGDNIVAFLDGYTVKYYYNIALYVDNEFLDMYPKSIDILYSHNRYKNISEALKDSERRIKELYIKFNVIK